MRTNLVLMVKTQYKTLQINMMVTPTARKQDVESEVQRRLADQAGSVWNRVVVSRALRTRPRVGDKDPEKAWYCGSWRTISYVTEFLVGQFWTSL